ncbi:recombinase family protein [Ruminococcus sp.]|uniref:recombinase family protein n=1 Tax=Ruminococcus sp. TaxID=41978 RepID=UPI004028D7D1
MKGVIYARYSSDNQREKSIEGQIRECKAFAEKNDIQIVETYIFARNRYDSAHYKSILKRNGVKVISATEIISQGAEGILLESLLEGYVEYYSAKLSEKVIRGMKENALKCKYNGGTLPIGYVIDENKSFQIDTLVAPLLLLTLLSVMMKATR